MLSFANASYRVESSFSKVDLVENMENLEVITKWSKKSGLKVNQEKTGLGPFYKQDTTAIRISVGDAIAKSISVINVLGVMFDAKLQWSNHIAKTTARAIKALNAIKSI